MLQRKLFSEQLIKYLAKTIFGNLQHAGFQTQDFIKLATSILNLANGALNSKEDRQDLVPKDAKGDRTFEVSEIFHVGKKRKSIRYDAHNLELKILGEGFELAVIDICQFGICCDLEKSRRDIFFIGHEFSATLADANNSINTSMTIRWVTDSKVGIEVKERLDDFIDASPVNSLKAS